MPTGYTAMFLENSEMTFEQWALQCSRAFGVLVHMRDEPLGVDIPIVVQPSSYYREAEGARHAQALRDIPGCAVPRDRLLAAR